MTFTPAVKNGMLELIDETGGAVAIERISMHTADPGTTGASEVTGGSYARAAVTWNPAASGVKANSGSMVFQIPAGVTITHVGGWTTGGTFRGGGLLTLPQPYATAGTYTIAAGQLGVTI